MVKQGSPTEQAADFLRRLEDLSNRCERSGSLTATPFLTPAEQGTAAQWIKQHTACTTVFYGGHPDCERRVLFFLPDWLPREDFAPSEHLCAIVLEAMFGTPEHRDYMGALLGMGVRREFVGDIRVDGQTATVFCLPSVAGHLTAIEQVGRVTVRAKQISPDEVSLPQQNRKEISFTVQSPRLDAVLSDVFRISRETAAKLIKLGAASLNYLPCLKPDAAVGEGSVLSLKGYGKAQITAIGGQSKKGRTYLHAEVYQ